MEQQSCCVVVEGRRVEATNNAVMITHRTLCPDNVVAQDTIEQMLNKPKGDRKSVV